MITEVIYHNDFREHALFIICLCKAKIALLATLSAVAGLFLASTPSGRLTVVLMLGVFLLASGAGALNHYQERHTDLLMNRTAGRPLPAGRIKPETALFLSILLISSGCVILLAGGSPAAAILGLAAVFWYNGFYTWFKARNSFAAIPGALVGAIPPAIGWLAGGGNMLDFKLAVLCFFFFVWQVFHFLIHMLTYGREYEEAGLPSLSAIFTASQLNRLAFQWLLAAVVSAQLIVLFGVIHSTLAHTGVIAASFWLAFQGITFIRKPLNAYAGIFRKTNYYMLLLVLLMTFDGLFRFRAAYYVKELIK